MILPIKWGAIESLLKKRFALQEEVRSPVFYFENEEEIYIYKETKAGNLLCAEVYITEISDFVAFKQEYLVDAIEFTSKPKDNTLIIKTE